MEIDIKLKEKIVKFRRDLHRIPELDRDLPKTKAYVLDVLSRLHFEVEPVNDAGYVAYFKVGKDEDGVDPASSAGTESSAETVAFRTDMDALPIHEATGLPFSSKHAGQMHACGHDGHMAIMLGFAEWIDAHKEQIAKNILLIFQAAEETTGGAHDFVEAGILSKYNVDRIYGMHLWPNYPLGTVVSMPGPFMAGAMVFYINIKGLSTHVGKYKEGIDALQAAVDYVTRVYAAADVAYPEDVKRLLRFGVSNSGQASNVVPASAYLEGTLRDYDKKVHDTLWGMMQKIAADISKEYGCSFNFEHSFPYPTVINDVGLFERAKAKLSAIGLNFETLEEPVLISEDFACYQEAVPGLFMFLGTGETTPLHSVDYKINEDALEVGVNVFRTLLED